MLPQTARAEILTAAVARARRSAADPACVAWLGPVAPGATMPGGARVPGLCHELDPVQAAFNLGVMLAWDDAEPATPYDIRLAALLAAGDWWARRQRLLAAKLPTVGDLLRALEEDEVNASPARAVLQLLGHRATTQDEPALATPHPPALSAPVPAPHVPQRALQIGDAAANAVRIALLCLRRSGGLSADTVVPTIQSPGRSKIVDDLPLDEFITGLCGL